MLYNFSYMCITRAIYILTLLMLPYPEVVFPKCSVNCLEISQNSQGTKNFLPGSNMVI